MKINLVSKIFLIWLILGLILIGLMYVFRGLHDAAGCVVGVMTIGFNLWTLIWAWQRIFNRKGLALAVSVIVLKYPILIFTLHWLITRKKISVFGFLIGFGLLFTILVLVTTKYYKEQLDKS